MTGKIVIVTGANGLLGRELLGQLTGTCDIRALVHTIPADPVPGVQYSAVDFSSDWDVGILPAKASDIVHLAQSAHFRDVPARALEVFQVNITATARLLDYAWRTGVERFIFASSGGIYGNGTKPFQENSPISQPDSLGYYLGSKVSGEALASSYAKFMKVMILRFFFIYGQRQNRGMLVPRLADTIRAGKPVTIQGEKGLRLNPIHVVDAAKAVVASLHSESSAIYNVAGPEVLSLRALCEEMASQMGAGAHFQTVPGDPFDVVGDIDLMRSQLHDPIIPPRVGIRDIIA